MQSEEELKKKDAMEAAKREQFKKILVEADKEAKLSRQRQK